MKLFSPSGAIVRDIPRSFLKSLKEHEPREPIDLKLAQWQHEKYVKVLKSLLKTVYELPAEEKYPDCCFVEDTAVIIGKRAAINFLGARERQGEEESIRYELQKLGFETHNIRSPGRVDGGDVLFTGQHLVVGISRRTNEEGARQLTEIFGGLVPVLTVRVTGTLHLKSVMSAFDSETLLFGVCEASKHIQAQLGHIIPLSEDYTVQSLPDSIAANVLSLGEHVVIQDGFPESERTLTKLADRKKRRIVKLDMSEFMKADGALTCCSLLF
jgi:dimethylargininase